MAEKSFNLFIINLEKQTDSYISYLVKIEEGSNFKDRFILNIYKDKKIANQEEEQSYYKKYGNFKYGDIITIKGKIVIPKTLKNLHEFDYRKYLNSRNIVGTITTYDASLKSLSKSNILTHIYKVKQGLENTIDNKLPCREANLFKSMLYGNDRDLDVDIKEGFTKLGLSHLLAVSGTNVGILILILSKLYKKIMLNKVISFIITCIIIFGFCAISEFQISVIRASIIAIMFLLTSLLSIKLNKFICLVIAFFLIILYNPYSIFNLSFILSFSAFAGILLFSNRINSLFDVYIAKIFGIDNVLKIKNNKGNKLTVILYKTLKIIAGVISLYFSVQILIIPIQIYFFNTFPVISLLSNIVIYIFALMQHILGSLYLFLYNIPYISDILINLIYLVLWLIIRVINFLMSINILYITFPKPDYISIFSYYILVILTCYDYKIVYYLKYRFKSINIKLIYKIICTLLVAYIIYFNIYTTYFRSFVYFFNVEQGNMAVIKSGKNSILVDMGSTGKANLGSILESFMKAYNMSKVDFFIVTHLHSDHVNGLFKLEDKLVQGNIKIENVIYTIPKREDNKNTNRFSQSDISYLQFENFLNKYRIKQIMVEKFDKIQVNKNTVIDILNPMDKYIIRSKDIMNSNSLIALVTINKSNYLFMGDSTVESEKIMLGDIYNLQDRNSYLQRLNNLKAIQIGHHGSSTSTSHYLLKNINARLAVISSKKSVYGHPSIVVKNILKKYGISTHITEENGGALVNN